MFKWIFRKKKKPLPVKPPVYFINPVVAFKPKDNKVIKLLTHDDAKAQGFNISEVYQCLHKIKLTHKGYYFVSLNHPHNCRCIAKLNPGVTIEVKKTN